MTTPSSSSSEGESREGTAAQELGGAGSGGAVGRPSWAGVVPGPARAVAPGGSVAGPAATPALDDAEPSVTALAPGRSCGLGLAAERSHCVSILPRAAARTGPPPFPPPVACPWAVGSCLEPPTAAAAGSATTALPKGPAGAVPEEPPATVSAGSAAAIPDGSSGPEGPAGGTVPDGPEAAIAAGPSASAAVASTSCSRPEGTAAARGAFVPQQPPKPVLLCTRRMIAGEAGVCVAHAPHRSKRPPSRKTLPAAPGPT